MTRTLTLRDSVWFVVSSFKEYKIDKPHLRFKIVVEFVLMRATYFVRDFSLEENFVNILKSWDNLIMKWMWFLTLKLIR